MQNPQWHPVFVRFEMTPDSGQQVTFVGRKSCAKLSQ
jgi:hypothetical protein